MVILSAVFLLISTTFLVSTESSSISKWKCQDPGTLLKTSIFLGTANAADIADNDKEEEEVAELSSQEKPVRLRSLCPWDIVKLTNNTRYPSVLKMARCQNERWAKGRCLPIMRKFTVLSRTDKCMKSSDTDNTEPIYAYIPDVIDLPVACASVSDSSRR